MKYIEKKRLSPKSILLIVLLSVLLLLVLGYFLTKGLTGDGDGEGTATPPEIFEGEALYLNSAIAYPRVSESSIQYIAVSNKYGSFDLIRHGIAGGEFLLSYDNGSGIENAVEYTPPIVSAEGNFDYRTLYAKETGDGYGSIYLLTYLSVALGTPYFNERIPLPKVKSERELLLAEYGFDKETDETISFAYFDGKDKDGKDIVSTHKITIGGNAVSGMGYYYMVDDRDFVYYTNQSYFEYALRGFHTFVNGMLVAPGIPSDSTFEPYLTSNFTEWANEKHKTEGEAVMPGSTVVVEGYSILPLKKDADYRPEEGAPSDGYHTVFEELDFPLDELKSHHDFKRISSILTGLSVGTLGEEKTVTLTLADGEGENMLLDFSESSSFLYKYSILEIESIITDTDEITAEGELVGDRNLVKIKYYYYVDGTAATSMPRHAVLDLSSELLPDEAEADLRASAIGGLQSPIIFEVNYSKDSSYRVDSCFVIEKIAKIYDSKGEVAYKVAKDSIVVVEGYMLINGRKEAKSFTLDLGKIGDPAEDDDSLERLQKEIKGKIIGLERPSKDVVNTLKIEVGHSTKYYELVRDFTAYTVQTVKYFITSEMITSFSFVNASDRDPYYGESFYENKLTNEYGVYGLNASACEKVAAFLGGIGATGSVTSAGFSGETVAVGLNHKTLDKYDLYNYKIYFELPRIITDISEGKESDSADELSDYDWYSTLGFTLYISDKKYDPDTGAAFRYVASDMYDLVAKVYGEELDFVEYSFTEFWARRNFLLTSIDRIENINVSFNFEDFDGVYNFEVTHRDIYIATVGNQNVPSYEPIEGGVKVDQVSVFVSAGEDNKTYTEFDRILEANKKLYPKLNDVSISQIYAEVQNGGKPMQEDVVNTVGVSNFKSVFELTQLVRFHGVLTDGERALADGMEPCMTIKVQMDTTKRSDKDEKTGYYTYEFIRFDDRKVMVRLYETDENGTPITESVSDFYITTFALKKLANNYIKLLNGVSVDRDIGYIE